MSYISQFFKGDAVMRKVVVLSLAVLAIAFVPVLAPANAPIFIDVPGMITIGPHGPGASVYVDAFGSTLDAAANDRRPELDLPGRGRRRRRDHGERPRPRRGTPHRRQQHV